MFGCASYLMPFLIRSGSSGCTRDSYGLPSCEPPSGSNQPGRSQEAECRPAACAGDAGGSRRLVADTGLLSSCFVFFVAGSSISQPNDRIGKRRQLTLPTDATSTCERYSVRRAAILAVALQPSQVTSTRGLAGFEGELNRGLEMAA